VVGPETALVEYGSRLAYGCLATSLLELGVALGCVAVHRLDGLLQTTVLKRHGWTHFPLTSADVLPPHFVFDFAFCELSENGARVASNGGLEERLHAG